ncbi:hypothetical protein COV24_03080 [candidate division WWE3 bacterium CG10_big_fil_rev_8_21_14_0_10_32_10]|uniref:ASCH domain-containing protein n=1 Tax=candidate division WWE3 bacterium CG10_big_fil_rev_8_21_14_0_10_32_10 TaxID=1975090 RepID=A0A2H0RA59_UNCKA|nr:MAG: hypothetical protein COV24_03080 [candidate division WWE3 bacterium CG10_big_fil_rev_8_21_14_0_10_32_10]
MNHIAFLTKKYNFIQKILAKEKTIESRWYKTKRAPWDKIKKGDVVYFKETGMPVSAIATVSKIIQFSDLNNGKIKEIYIKYGGRITADYTNSINKIKMMGEFTKNKKYCILVFLKNPKKIEPFNINKMGFGNSCAWICTEDIKTTKN